MQKFLSFLPLALLASSALPAASVISNADFAGGLSGWTVSNGGVGLGGNAQVLTSLGPISPVGSRFALVATGPALTLGSVTPTFGELSQSFTLGSAATLTLQVQYTLLTALFTPTSAPHDTFVIEITGPANTNFLSASTASAFSAIDGGNPVSVAGGVLDGTSVYDALSGSINQAVALGAGTYTLRFRVANGVDSLFDSGMLIEGLSLDDGNTSGIPEPSAISLLVLGAGGLGLLRRRQ